MQEQHGLFTDRVVARKVHQSGKRLAGVNGIEKNALVTSHQLDGFTHVVTKQPVTGCKDRIADVNIVCGDWTRTSQEVGNRIGHPQRRQSFTSASEGGPRSPAATEPGAFVVQEWKPPHNCHDAGALEMGLGTGNSKFLSSLISPPRGEEIGPPALRGFLMARSLNWLVPASGIHLPKTWEEAVEHLGAVQVQAEAAADPRVVGGSWHAELVHPDLLLRRRSLLP